MVDHGNFVTHILVLDGENSNKLTSQMKVIFGVQDICDMVETSVEASFENATVVQRKTHKEDDKIDCNAPFRIHQSVENYVWVNLFYETIGGRTD
ncbi:unnamed protein product [Lathyrus sativus]|nr:unnamed protein product [Lathyrus sativus]